MLNDASPKTTLVPTTLFRRAFCKTEENSWLQVNENQGVEHTSFCDGTGT